MADEWRRFADYVPAVYAGRDALWIVGTSHVETRPVECLVTVGRGQSGGRAIAPAWQLLDLHQNVGSGQLRGRRPDDHYVVQEVIVPC